MFFDSKYNLKNVHRDKNQLHSSKIFQINSRLNIFTNDHRPLSPITGHRLIKKENCISNQHSGSYSPWKIFSSNYRQLTEEKGSEKRLLLEREPLLYIEHERHTIDHRKKVLKSFIPILHQNLYIVDRLSNIKSVQRMNEDFIRHTTKEVTVQRHLILPKMNLK